MSAHADFLSTQGKREQWLHSHDNLRIIISAAYA